MKKNHKQKKKIKKEEKTNRKRNQVGGIPNIQYENLDNRKIQTKTKVN